MKMRNLALLVMLAAVAIMAMAASSAAAFTEFLVVGAKPTGKGGAQELVAKGSAGKSTTVKCEEVVTKGEVVTATLLHEEGEYLKCKIAGIAAEVKTPCVLSFHPDGTVDILNKPTGCVDTILAKATGCEIKIKGGQLGLKSVTYKNIKEDEMEVSGTVGGIAFETATGKACGFTNASETGTASYTGKAVLTNVDVK